MSNYWFLLFCFGTIVLSSCKKDSVTLEKKGDVYFESIYYPLHIASQNSTLAYATNDNGFLKQFYSHIFILKSSDGKNLANIQVISNDKTLVDGEYFLKGFSSEKNNGSITLNLELNKFDYGSLIQLKAKVSFQNNKALKVDFLYDGNQVDINWNGLF